MEFENGKVVGTLYEPSMLRQSGLNDGWKTYYFVPFTAQDLIMEGQIMTCYPEGTIIRHIGSISFFQTRFLN